MTIDEISIPQASTSEFHLTCKRTGEIFPLDKEVLVGREIDCTIRLLDAQIRRYHAKITASDDGLFLEDLNAKNNTYLNGSRIGTGAWITLGDEINLDGIRFCVEPAKPNPNSEIQASIRENASKVKSDYKAPDMPFSNQDVLEATRAMEERAKARLQLFKETEELGQTPNWEDFIAKRYKEKAKEAESAKAKEPKAIEDALDDSIEVKQPIKQVDLPNAISDFDQALATFDAANDAEVETESTDQGLLGEPVFLDQLEVVDEPSETIEPPTNKPKSVKSAIAVGSGPRLIIKTAPLRGKVYQLEQIDAKATWTIGRAVNADIQLTETEIDLIHAHIELVDQGYKIRTTRSTNGMLINGILKNEATLNHGDSVQFGRTEFQFAANTKNSQQDSNHHHGSHKLNYGLIAASLVILGALLVALLNSPS